MMEAMQAIFREQSEEKPSDKEEASYPGSSTGLALNQSLGKHSRTDSSEADECSTLIQSTSTKMRVLASKIAVPEGEIAERDDGSHVVFTVQIKPPPRSLEINWKYEDAMDRMCRVLDKLVEAKAEIHQFSRERPEYTVGFPTTLLQQDALTLRCFMAILVFIAQIRNCMPSRDDRDGVRLLITDLEIIAEWVSASIAATQQAAENSTSQAEDDCIRRQFQRWLLQTWADLEDVEQQINQYSRRWDIQLPLDVSFYWDCIQ
ncbi:uncharacterized protein GIQ15_02092 [Arthroderma uncinatum]|uniref:uncharacterized protein n=1 Tax=Arthroderma uncinatum TaxID=74035 RepID=UPI00144A9D88|nr:uncharacterized protein GIQ15_02092 [Arthroderma uncinatum]KAF3482768.1 hypothetical protein GIQ15_02092 [Arthroderma uncinatum]